MYCKFCMGSIDGDGTIALGHRVHKSCEREFVDKLTGHGLQYRTEKVTREQIEEKYVTKAAAKESGDL
jgi:hypothetical protein